MNEFQRTSVSNEMTLYAWSINSSCPISSYFHEFKEIISFAVLHLGPGLNLDQTNYAVCLLIYSFKGRGCSGGGPEWTIHAAVAMDSQTEETQDTDTDRGAMCVTIKEWPLDSLQGCHTGPLRLSVASGFVQSEEQQ